MSTPQPIKAAQYLRMSTDHQKYSLVNQAAVIALYAETHGYELVRTYQDAGKSGVTTAGRDGLKALLSDVIGGKAGFSAILVLDVSRWGRFQDPDQGAHYEFVCRDAGVAIRYCGELFDDDGSVGSSILKHLKRVMAGEYSRELSEKVRAGKRRQGAKGLTRGGVAPYGFRRQIVNADGSPGAVLTTGSRKHRPDQNVRPVPGPPDELRVIRAIFRWFVDDRMTIAAVVNALNIRGRMWADGTPWTCARVTNVLTCDLVVGRQVVGRTYYRFGETGKVDPSEWIITRLFPPIVSPRRFDAAQQRWKSLRPNKGLSDEEIIADLRTMLSEHGKLTHRILERHGKYTLSVYQKWFGSYANAYTLAGFQKFHAPKVRDEEGKPLTREALAARLSEHFITTGHINGLSINDASDLPSSSYVAARFGGLPAAYAAAGIPYPRPRPQRRKAPASQLPSPGRGRP